MISQVCQPALVESGMRDLCSFATPVVPELGGKARKKTLTQVIDGPEWIHALPRPR
jgi:hypothetical protein